jgi:hypothetical protein
MNPHCLRMVWWNTALSPVAPGASTKATTETHILITEHIKRLFTEFSCDLVGLCEVSVEDIAYMESNLNLTNIEMLDLTCEVGRTRFDIAVVYNSKKIHLKHRRSLSKTLTDSTIKAAQLVEITNIQDTKSIQLFLCHWASRLRGDGDKRRKAAARILYDDAKLLLDEGQDVIIMGDFNDNPYDGSILDGLNSSRCIDSVRKYPKEYFYNPFWRSVVSKNQYSHTTSKFSFQSGTHRYKEVLGTFWHSYDQIMFSGSFLGTGDWHLNELNTNVIDEIGFVNDFDDKKNIIDHLPVVCEITRP